jgi:hypothetical protein
MIKFVLPKSVLFALILCFGAASLPAQELEMQAPPIPEVIPTPPPDPDTLPPPPPLEWQSLLPKGSEEEQPPGDALAVLPPEPETRIAPPPPGMVETPLPGLPDPAEMERAKPEVEIWRPQSESPQVPERRSNNLDWAYVTGTEPATLRVQFDPLLAGKSVYVRPGFGITLNPSAPVLTVSATGECLIAAQIAEGIDRSHIIFYCEGVKTVLPVMRAPVATVVEAETEGGQ